MVLLLLTILLANERIAFDADRVPHFSEQQVRASAESTRAGFVKWAATAEGKEILAKLDAADREIHISESADESGFGRAPQPGFATLLASQDEKKIKTYQLILNPTRAAEYRNADSIDFGEPRTPADVMAVAWAAEMLHIEFYARGIPLPHHRRKDFQERWLKVATALGFPLVEHDDEAAPDDGIAPIPVQPAVLH